MGRIYPSELSLNSEAPFLDLHLSVSDGFVSSEIYEKRYEFDYDMISFPFYPPTERFRGYSDEPGVRPFLVCSIT